MASDTRRPRIVTAIGGSHRTSPTTVDGVRSTMADAIAQNEPVRIVGAETWRDGGPPVDATRTLSLAGLTGIIAYVPGDLTITTWAGTTLAELAHVTAAHGQWLGLDPAGARTGTIGATLSTASAGPLAHAFGTPRDLVLGLDAVTGYGDVVKPGGRVVKNVAGFDLVRLFTGSWGTLGAITSATLRLRALPVHDATIAMEVSDAAPLATLIEALRRNTLSLLACEWVDGVTARALDVSDGADVILLRIGGTDAFVRGQRAVLDAITSCRPCDPATWGLLAALDRDASAVVRLSGSVSSLPARIARIRASLTSTPTASIHASIARGIVRVIVSGDAGAARDLLQRRLADEQRIVERLPAGWWAAEPDPFTIGLSGRIRAAFDPQQLCNRRTADA
ncbi:MAG: FAD-binding oxidoreductase [Gemmatimonadaceae bacterium]|nr:FAD-binding oxidoreductase [Gemmatimonadaceae bacterium]